MIPTVPSRSGLKNWRALVVGLSLGLTGCLPSVPLKDLADTGTAPIFVELDANSRVVQPGRRLRFYVDIRNASERKVDLSDVSVELTASPADDASVVALRKSWSYRWKDAVTLSPGKKITLPITPESHLMVPKEPSRFTRQRPRRRPIEYRDLVTVSEFPLENLRPGEYEIRAHVNDRFRSKPYRLVVDRIDLSRRQRRFRPDPSAPTRRR